MFEVDKKCDSRPHLKIEAYGHSLVALVDSGASISEQKLPISVDGTCKVMKFWVVPTIRHFVILGNDFCEKFGTVIDWNQKTIVVNDKREGCEVGETTNEAVMTVNKIICRGELNSDQEQNLREVIGKFKSLSWEAGTNSAGATSDEAKEKKKKKKEGERGERWVKTRRAGVEALGRETVFGETRKGLRREHQRPTESRRGTGSEADLNRTAETGTGVLRIGTNTVSRREVRADRREVLADRPGETGCVPVCVVPVFCFASNRHGSPVNQGRQSTYQRAAAAPPIYINFLYIESRLYT
ncbi:hypothetical protein Zmor_011112 [Zophobas morio]|uniref:Uncharacterized protein n=1 Tax=Zophobas morio TaxID=2755281 RepID=A0AA38MKM3_9CUCU|nr:hypothetical protein Zmor_011112 [Zophobas morio]